MVSTWPHNNRTNLHNFRFVLMLVCFPPQIFCHRLARSTSKLDFVFNQQFRFWSITQPIMSCHVSVHSSAFCLRHRARDPISVAFYDRVVLFSDFNHLFELLDQVLPLQQQCLLQTGSMLKKHFKNAHGEFYEQFSCGNACFPYKALEQNPGSRMQSLSESRGV